MKKKTNAYEAGNWLLLSVSIALILVGLTLIVLSIAYIASFGWWSLAVGLTGVTTAAAAAVSIAENDPTWILLDLIIP